MAAQIGALRILAAFNAGQFIKGGKKAEGALNSLARTAKLAGGALGSAFAFSFSTSLISKATAAYMKQAEAVRLVENTLRGTGHAAGFGSQQLQKMASDLQAVSTYGDENILASVTNNLLTFGRVVGPVFERAQQASLDLSTVLQQDLKSSAIQIGKALNDPIAGITALSRVGIAFTADQKQMIGEMMMANNVMGAQGVILDELERFYGGAAKAAGDTTGIVTKAANAIGDMWESVGKAISPEVQSASQTIIDFAGAFQALNPNIVRFATLAASLTLAAGGAAAAVGLLGLAFGAVSTPIIATVGAVGLIGAALITSWKNIKAAAGAIWDGFKFIYDGAKAWLYDKFKPVIDWFNRRIRDSVWLLNKIGKAVGFESLVTSTGEALTATAEVVKKGLADIGELIFPTTAEWGATVAHNMVKPVLSAAEIAEISKTRISDATKEVMRLQQQVVEDGVRLATEMKTPFQVMTEDVHKLQAALAEGRISQQQYANAATRAAYVSASAYGDMAGQIAGNLQSVFGDSKAAAIASAIVNTYQAFTNAMANIPAPYNFAVAGSALAAGFAQVAKIRSTSLKSGGGGGSAASAGASTPTPASAPAAAPAPQNQSLITIEGLDPGSMFSGEQVRSLMSKMFDEQRDGHRLVFAG